jgi:uncharacterized membrane protein YsdA (DUF1294 family)/cold shock CspA family protein
MAIQTDRGALRDGQLVRWDPAKGLGFIRPADGGRDVFLHISALPGGQAPEIGNRLVFSAVDDPQGRGQRALKAIVDGEVTAVPFAAPLGTKPRPTRVPPPAGRGTSRLPNKVAEQGSGTGPRSAAFRPRRRDQTLRALPINAQNVLVGLLALGCVAGAATMLHISPIPLIAYPALSLFAYLMYARDKLSAIRGTWRVSESSLHLVEAAGGWPGAYVAQQTMRHKTLKASYQVVFWLIVSGHVGFWVLWIFFPEALGLWLPPKIEWSR